MQSELDVIAEKLARIATEEYLHTHDSVETLTDLREVMFAITEYLDTQQFRMSLGGGDI